MSTFAHYIAHALLRGAATCPLSDPQRIAQRAFAQRALRLPRAHLFDR